MGFVKNGLKFREVEESDLPYLRLWRNMPEMAAGWQSPESVQTAYGQLEWYKSLGPWKQAYIVEDQSVVVGLLRFTLEPEKRRGALTGTDVAPNQQRKGYGKRILRSGAEYILHDLGYHRVTAESLDLNEAAQKIIIAAGFTHEGTLRDYVWRNGEWRDWEIFALLESEWRANYEYQECNS
jgi:RimJ/RimL family protein N-acetyltransferase